MICRLATCEDAEEEVSQTINSLKDMEYLFWGNDRALNCDYLFIHSQGDSSIAGILKVRGIRHGKDISKEEFLGHEPSIWGKEMRYKKYFVIEAARKVNIPREFLKDSEGNPIRAMHDMNFVTSEKFEPF